jgi:hypothetical protein
MFPGASTLATQIWGINPTGDFVGFYRNAPGNAGVHGFLQPGDGSAPVPLNYVDSDTGAHAALTEAFAINPAGAIVGAFLDSSGGEHGFLAVQSSN